MLQLKDFTKRRNKICIVGIGYVGLPLAILLSTKYEVIAFDINPTRIEELKKGYDKTGEVEKEKLLSSLILFTSDPEQITQASVIIITVPTPIDVYNKPDLSHLKKATSIVGNHLNKDTVVVYESTVYPGTTEEVCIPILEQVSNLKWKRDFFIGYSPERVNPGDREHTIDKIIKVVSADSNETADFVESLYGSVITAGVHRCPDIKTAEAAKIIENTQRDLNIALMNELTLIFNKMSIETKEVLKAAGTKWNFLNFSPGLVGGHCIGVDPYYLTFKAESLGYHPEIILAGRRINDSMGKYIAEVTIKKLIKAGKTVKDSKLLILGITFKENISDSRNTRVVDIYRELLDFEIQTFIYDPNANSEEVNKEYNITLIDSIEEFQPYDAVIVAVKHKSFSNKIDLNKIKAIQGNTDPMLFDVKGLFNKREAEQKGISYWEL